MKLSSYRFFLLPLLFVVLGVLAIAQANSGVTGIVTDQTGAVVAGAKITLTDPATGITKSTVSSATGLYEIAALNAANYNMKVTAKGFQTYVQNGVVVNVSSTFRSDVKLTVGAESTTITVEADALAVQGDSNVVSTLINEQQITELATNGRNIVALASLGLGVSGNLPDSNTPTSVGSSFAISFNGLNQAHNIWLIDGGEAYDRGSGGKSSMMPSQDSLGEFQVLSSNFPPEYGISSGATISMSLKQGTKAFHGELWEFDRNDALQAHNYFDAPGAKKPELRLNIYGGNVGGPVFIPHTYNTNKNKTFFFYNEEWRKIVQGSAPAGIHAVPNGDLLTAKPSTSLFAYKLPAYVDASQTQLFVPYTTNTAINQKLTAAGIPLPTKNADGSINYVAFPNNQIPTSLLDPVALQMNTVGAIPQANVSGDLTSVSSKQPTNVREDTVRIDHTINDKWQIFGHYIHDSVSQTYATSMWSGDSYPTVGSNFTNPSNSVVIKTTGTLSQNVVVEAAINYDGNKINIMPSGTAYTKPSGWTGAGFFPAANDGLNRLPTVNLSSWGTAFDPWSQPWKNAAQDISEVFGLSMTAGKHAIKVGGGYNRYTKNQQIFGNTNGNYTFGDGWTKGAYTNTVGGATFAGHPNGVLTGDSYLDFLLGLSTGYSQLENQDIRHYVNQTVSIYAQDTWHVTNRLSVQYGFRFDALPHAWERNDRITSFDPAQYQPALAPILNADGTFNLATSPGLVAYGADTFYLNGVIIAGQNGTPHGLTKNDYNTMQPRIGFSYDMSGNGKTVLRAGFGTFYERMQGNDVYNVAAAAPFSNTPGVSNTTFANPYASWDSNNVLSNATLPVVPQGMTTIDKNYKAPGVAEYSLGVQHELAPSIIMTAQYVGNLAWHQNVELPINELPLTTSIATRKSAASSLSTYQNAMWRTYQGYNNIVQESNLATGTYNSFQIGVRQQDKHGLTFEVDYTWSHQIDDQVGSSDLNTSSNPWNLKYDKGSGALDRRQMLNTNYIYKLPIFAKSTGLAHSILGGWELSGTFIAEAGMPWAGNNAPGYGGADTVGLGGNYTIRPNMSGKPHYVKSRVNGVYQWVDKTGMSSPVAPWNGGTGLGFGNMGRDAIVGPSRINFGTNLYKSFAITERAHVELRAESFNTFNHTQFNNFHNGFSGGDFGQVSGVQDPRTFELGGKFIF